MWQTPQGERTVVGAEAALLRAAIAYVADMIERDAEIEELNNQWFWGVAVFDQLAWQQKLALLAQVASALLESSTPPPQLTVISEGAVGALYEAISQQIEYEIDDAENISEFGGDPYRWRRLVLSAIREIDCRPAPLDDELPRVECSDKEEWSILLETVESFVLWDGDWQMDDLFMDVDLETSRLRKERLNIAEDYFEAIPPDPSPSEVDEARHVLRRIRAAAQ